MSSLRRLVLLLGLFGMALAASPAAAQQPLHRTDAYTVTDTSVVQGDFRAFATSRTRITSNYQRERTAINFKFSINGRDNEAASGNDLRLRLDPVGGRFLAPVYVFGERPDQGFPQPTTVTRRAGTDSVEVVFRVDMRAMHRAFRQQGRYDPPSGEPIPEEAFEGVYIMGDTPPLTWDRSRLTGDSFRLTDADDDGVYRIALTFPRRDLRPLNEDDRAVWTLSDSLREVVSAYPQYRSDQRLVDALYNLSLEEVRLSLREDGAFMAGKKWTGVWTRDISYSILLSLALVEPEAAKTSLRAKVTPGGRIIQDTGTGGSWPVSTDRMTWALAAWETYLTTGDEDWLEESYDVIRRSAEADLRTAFDSTSGLFHGEASFMDWREQSYPGWMDPKDIYLSQVLSTNVVHHRTYRILAEMAEELGEPTERWTQVAETVQSAVNRHLWMPTEGRYASFRYGRNHPARSPRAEALGSALSIVTGLAEGNRAATLSRNHPVGTFGTPSFWPYIPNVPPYHNAGIWPFVTSYWTWASADARNTEGVEHGLGALYRAAALFLTNKENMVAQTGHFEGTQINSDRQLWSVAGNLASVYRVLFGMRFAPDGLRFEPFVPQSYSGTRTLENVSYRDATLDIEMRGYGSRIVQITLDGEPLAEPVVPADLSGEHDVRIVLSGGLPEGGINRAEDHYSPATPAVSLTETTAPALVWPGDPEVEAYEIFRNGTVHDTTTGSRYALPAAPEALAEYQVRAVGPTGTPSFLSEPIRHVAASAVDTVQVTDSLETRYAGYTGDGYLPLATDRNTAVTFSVIVEEAGTYALDVRYANGSGPINTDNKTAIRSVQVDGRRAGVFVLPQRGDGVWTDYGYSNPLHVGLAAGTHTVTLTYTATDRNMNARGDDAGTNAAHLDHLRITRLDEGTPGR